MTEPTAAPEACANCGAPIPRGARACPDCGADERTGWRENSIYDGLDLPDEAYADDRDGEDPSRSARRPTPRINGVAWYWWLAGALLVILFVVATLGLR